MEKITVVCPSCSHQMQVPENLLGKKGKCPKWASVIVVTNAAQQQAQQLPPAATNPLPWTEHWLKSKGVQVAPQETEVESYIIGGVKQDIKEDAFAGFQL